MSKAIIGRKLGMTQIFTEAGESVPVTVVKVGPCKVIRKKTTDGKDGYDALVVGFEEARSAVVDGEKKYKMNKAELGVFLKAGVEPMKSVHEIRVQAADLDKYEVGQEIRADLFVAGECVDVVGTSKGSGFTGVMKRHNFGGGRASHGGAWTRRPGSIGCCEWPGNVMKGKKMPGHMGNTRCTVQNLPVVKVLAEDNVICVRGCVPGAKGGILLLKSAIKKSSK